MAVLALSAVAAVALDLVADMPGEIFRTGLLCAAVSYCGGDDAPIEVDVKYLSDAERQFLVQWWDDTLNLFPELAS